MKNWVPAVILAVTVCAAAAAAAFVMTTRPKLSLPEEHSELVVYSPHPVEMVEYIVREFRQRTGIPVRVITAGTGDLMERIRQKDASGEADVFWGGGVESLETVKDLFRPYRSVEDSAIDESYKSEHGLWYPFSVLYTVIIYNKKLVREDHVPTSWARFLDPYFKGRIILPDPEVSGLSFTALTTMLLASSELTPNGFSDWSYVERLAEQLGTGGTAPSSSFGYIAVAAGDYFAGIAFENSARSLQKSGADVGFCFPEEGTSSVPDGIALLKNSRNPEAAGKFIDFVLGRDVQSLLMVRWYRRSVRTDILERPAQGASGVRLVPYRIRETAALRDSILDHWAEIRARKIRP